MKNLTTTHLHATPRWHLVCTKEQKNNITRWLRFVIAIFCQVVSRPSAAAKYHRNATKHNPLLSLQISGLR